MNTNQYRALYRKYRPTIFAEVKGQDHIVTTLKNIILNNKIVHGYLFSGPRGTGKTSVAKIFANTINCQHKINALEPCLQCITKIENNMDIIEMDAASNNGVDEIRELKEKTYNLPFNAPYKIYIIDEVHMLSKSAFNAFLKLLEEPPKHIIFILATTDPQKIPLTVLSRLQRFNFQQIDIAVIESQLKNVLDQENISYQESSIKTIARLANGGLRDALSMVDQVAVYGNNKIDDEVLFNVFGVASNQQLLQLIHYVENYDVKNVLHLTKSLIHKGSNIQLMILTLIEILRDYVIYKKTYDASLLTTVKSDDLQAINLDLNRAHAFLDTLIDIEAKIHYSPISEQLLELSLIKIAYDPQKTIADSIATTEFKNSDINETNSEIKKNEEKPEITNLDFDDVIMNPHSKNDLEDLLFSGAIVDNDENEEQEALNDNVFDDSNVVTTSEIELAEQEYELDSLTQDLEISDDKPEIPEAFKNTLFLETTEFLYDVQKPIIINRETNPEKILNLQKLSNDVMWESVEWNKQLQHDIEQEKLLQDSQKIVVESILSNDEDKILEQQIVDLENPRTSFSQLTLEHYYTKEIEVAKSVGHLIQKDIYNLEQVINFYALSDRETLEKYKEKFSRITAYENEEKYFEYISYLNNVNIITGGDHFVLVSSREDEVIWKINLFIKDHIFKDFISKIFGKPLHFVAISQSLFKKAKQVWVDFGSNRPKGIAIKPLVLKTAEQLTQEYIEELKRMKEETEVEQQNDDFAELTLKH
ncbi:DNA polymerase III subunit gamma/tau [Candidatus Mycoplasma pogonae]